MKELFQKIFVSGTFLCEKALKAACLTIVNPPKHKTLDCVLKKMGGHINHKGA